MPFTVSHVAAVLPLRARPRWAAALPAAPLALGAVVPDLPTAVGLPGWRSQTHTLLAAVTTDTVLAALLAVLWLVLVRPAVADVVPGVAVRWAAPGARATPAALVAVQWYLAGAIGAVTHVAWDDLTHSGGWFDRVAGLSGRHEAFLVLQVLSSVLGLAVLLWWVRRWWRARTPAAAAPHVVRWGHAVPALVVAAVLAGAVAAARYSARQAAPVASAGEGSPLVEAAFGALSGLLLAALLLAVVHRVATARRPA